jgi:hypothetical protein
MRMAEHPLQLSADEIVDVIEELLQIPIQDEEEYKQALGNAQALIEKLIGEDRQGRARFTTKFVLVDEAEAERLAEDLGISRAEAWEFFAREPIKYARVIAEWALEQADKTAMGLDHDYQPDPNSDGVRIHAQRGRLVADILGAWAFQNQRGVYRMAQEQRMGTPIDQTYNASRVY